MLEPMPVQSPFAAGRNQLVADQRLQDVQPVRPFARGRQRRKPELGEGCWGEGLPAFYICSAPGPLIRQGSEVVLAIRIVPSVERLEGTNAPDDNGLRVRRQGAHMGIRSVRPPAV